MDTDVKYDDLEYLPEGIYLYKNKPFTGLVTEYYPSGEKSSEMPFRNGREHGWWRSWYRNGQIESETPRIDGIRHGICREFFENGLLERKKVFEFGVYLRGEARNEKGEVIEEYERPQDDILFQTVLKTRQTTSWDLPKDSASDNTR